LSENVQLEQLLDEKSSVENEGNQLDEEQRQLRLRAKVLTEKIIQELKKRNNAKQENVNKLRCDVNDLESQLNALTVSNVLGDSGEIVESTEDTAEAVAASKEEPKETVEETTASSEELNIVSSTEVAQETDTNSTTKKKRKYF